MAVLYSNLSRRSCGGRAPGQATRLPQRPYKPPWGCPTAQGPRQRWGRGLGDQEGGRGARRPGAPGFRGQLLHGSCFLIPGLTRQQATRPGSPGGEQHVGQRRNKCTHFPCRKVKLGKNHRELSCLWFLQPTRKREGWKKKKKKSHREGSASAGFFRELKTQRRQAPGLSRGAPPQPRKPLRYFGKKCLSTVDPRHLTQVSPLTFSGITILDHPNICVHLQKASAGHCF